MNVMEHIIPNAKLRLGLFVLVGLSLPIIVGIILFPGKPPIPGPVKRQISSTILVPRSSGYLVDRDSAKYHQKEKLLTFKILKNDQRAATITEQPTPDTFTDIPEFSAKFFQQAGEYKTFDSVNGTVHLLHPQKGVKDAAAMNAKGTLMFVNPSLPFSEDEWRKLFQSIVAIQ
jgi:hypothetical protein